MAYLLTMTVERRPPFVMAGEGPPSTTFGDGHQKGVDGRPAPTITIKRRPVGTLLRRLE
jgi:hypothetical protein